MSFDTKHNTDDNEVDFGQSFRSIWVHKFSLLFLIILSVPVSIMYIASLKPLYKAETVFEKPKDKSVQGNSSLLRNIGGVGGLQLLSALGGSSRGSDDSFFSEIRSGSFLKTVVLNNAELDSQTVQEFCPLPSDKTSQSVLRSFLILLGLSENRLPPTEDQKISLLVKCVNNMLKISHDKYGSDESTAFRMSITSTDPVFSANLANQIVEKYFIRHEKQREQSFQNVKKYMSNVILESQLEFTEANKLMQSFIIKHTPLMDLKDVGSSQSNFDNENSVFTVLQSPFAAKLNEEILNLGQFEKSLSQLKKTRFNLTNLKKINQDNVKTFISSTELQGVLSRSFVSSISKIDGLSSDIRFKNQEIKKLVSKEVISLEQQIENLEDKIIQKEEQTQQLMSIENRFQELALDVSKKKFISEGLKDQLKEKILTTGLANVDRPILLTKAVPPFREAWPNKLLILVMGAFFSLVLGIAYILVRQNSLRKVHSLSQIQNLDKGLSCYEIKYKKLQLMSGRVDETMISQSFFSRAKETGKLGCIIDLSQKTSSKSLGSLFFKSIAALLARGNTKIVFLDTSQSKKIFSANSQNNFGSDNSGFDAQSTLNSSVFSVSDEDGMIVAGEVKTIKSKYSEYDKIICSLGKEIGDLTKFKFIEQCDFYILIGRSFHFDEYTYKKFSNAVWEKEKKCLGFFLID